MTTLTASPRIADLLDADHFAIIEHESLTTVVLFEGMEYRGEFDSLEVAQAHVEQIITARKAVAS